MAFCPNIADNKVLRKFNKIIKEFGGKSLTRNEFKDSKLRSEKTGIDLEAMDMAYYVWDKYNGNEIPETKEDILKGLITIDSEDSKNFLHLQNIMLSNQQKNTTAATNTKGEIKYNEKGEILAPNGKVSKLAKDIENLEGIKDKKQALELYKQIRTQEFKDWFGDWVNDPENSSKVVDENGEPLLVYHGTTKEFDTFDINKSVKRIHGKGSYFSSTKDIIKFKSYGNNIIIGFLNIKTPLYRTVSDSRKTNEEVIANRGATINFDGGIVKDIHVYIIFNSNQIKSIFNNGGFSKEDDNIFKAVNDNKNYTTITVNNKFKNKQEVLNKFDVKQIKSHYYYTLSKEEQKRVDAYLKASKGKGKIGKSRIGFTLSEDNKGIVTYRIDKGRGYLYIENKEYIDENGIILLKTVDYIKIPVDLVYNKEEAIYKKAIEQKTLYVPKIGKEINKLLFKTKGISENKSANWYLLQMKSIIINTLNKYSENPLSYSDLKSLNEQQKQELLKKIDINNAIKEVREQFKKYIDSLNVEELKKEIIDLYKQHFDKESLDYLPKLLDLLPDKFLKLITFNLVDYETAFFQGTSKLNDNKFEELRKLIKTDDIKIATGMNVALRKMLDDKLITKEQLDLANNLLEFQINKYLKLKEKNPKLAEMLKLHLIKKTKILSKSGVNISKFNKYWEKAIKQIEDAASNQNKGLVELTNIITKSLPNLNSVFTEITLGKFKEKNIQKYNIDNFTVALHELGHSLDLYLKTTKPEVNDRVYEFIDKLIDSNEFKEYIKKELKTRGYTIENRKEISADIFAYILGKSIGYDLSKGHLKSLDDFFTSNINLVNKLYNNISGILVKENIKNSYNPNKLIYGEKTKEEKIGETIEDTGIIKLFKDLLNEIIEKINNLIGKNIFKPIGYNTSAIYTTMDGVTTSFFKEGYLYEEFKIKGKDEYIYSKLKDNKEEVISKQGYEENKKNAVTTKSTYTEYKYSLGNFFTDLKNIILDETNFNIDDILNSESQVDFFKSNLINEDNQNNEPPEIENIPSNEPFLDDSFAENPVDNIEMQMQSLDEAFNLSNLDPDEFSYMAGVQSKQKSWKEKYDALTKKQKTLVNEIRKRKRLLNRKLNNSKTKTEKALIQAKIDTINKQVWDILDNFDKIIGTAKWHLGHVETEFKKFINKDLSELSKKEIDASIEEINTLKNFINIWRDIDLLYPENDSVKEILALSTNLEHKFFILSKKYFLASAQKYDSSITEEKLYENQTDINKVTALELNSYHNNSLVAQHTTELIEKAQFEANKDARNAYNSLQDEYERAMQATGLTRQQLEEAVLDKDEDGKPVNRIIRRESLKFTETLIDKYKKRGKAINEVRKWKEIKENVGKIPKENRKVSIEEINKRLKQAEKQAKSAKSEFTQWLKDNTYSVTTDILNKLEKGEKINTTHFTANELRKQKQLLENYRADKRMFLMFELELDPSDKENAKLTGKELIDKVEQDDDKTLNYLDWEKQNSPFDALTAKQRRGSKYLIKSVPKEQWYNEEFTTLQKNKELYSFYNYILDYIEENNSHYPMSAQKDLEAYLPNVPKTQWEIITQSKVNKFLNIMGDDFIKSISSELDNSIEHSLIIDGKTLNNIPIKKSREIDREREKIDLFGSLKAQTVASRLYKFNTEVQPIAELADTILGNNETQKTTESGAYVKNVFRELFTEKGGAKNTRDQLRYTIDTYLYNKSRKKATWHLFKIFTKEEVEKLNKFSEDYTEELKDKLKNGIITQEEYDEAQKYNLDASDPRGSIRMFKQKLRKDLDNKKITQEEFDKKLSFVDKIGRKVTSNNLTDFAIKWTYLQALAFPNVFSPTVNLIQGMTTNIIHSARKSDFTFKELRQANRLIVKAVFTKTVQGKRKVTGDFKKILAFSQELGLIEDFNEHTKKSWVDKLSIFQQNAEWMNQVLTMVAMLKHLKINNEAGERSIWDNYTYDKRGDLVWDKENYGEEPQNSTLKIISDEGGVNLFKLKLRAQAVIEDIHGDYAHAMLAKNTNLGKILMLFRTWLPKAVELRTGKERFDSRLGRTRKGRYRSVIEGFKTQQGDRVSMGEFLLAFMPFKDSTLKFSDLSDVDQENVRANLSELAIIAGIAMAILLTNLLGDDDDDSLTKSLKIFALNTMSRSLADVLFFLNPNSSYKVFDKVIPIYTPISNLFSITNVVIDSFTKGANMQQGPFKDWNRFVKWGMINTPGLSGISKNISFSYKQYNMN